MPPKKKYTDDELKERHRESCRNYKKRISERGVYQLVPIKKCGHCKDKKISNLFYNSKYTIDGLTSWCKECWKEYYPQSRIRAREWGRENKDENYARSKKWSQSNRERSNASKWMCEIKRRGLKNLVPGDSFNGRDWLIIKEAFDNTCLACNRPEPEISLTADHVVPLSRGGDHHRINIQPLCKSCNSKKHTKIIDYRPSFMSGIDLRRLAEGV